MLCCADCGEVIIKSSDKGIKVRTKILLVGKTESFAVCRQCGVEIPVPISLDMARMGAVLKSAKLRLFVNK